MASTPINTSMTPAPVLDVQANQILKDIYSFLNKQNGQSRSDSDNLQSGIDNLTDRIDRDNKLSRSEVKSNNKAVVKALTGIANSQNKESVRSSQSNARDRATNQIFNNKINKNVDGFKNTLLKTLGDLKDFLKTQILACLEKSLRSFTDLAKTMRKANLTRAQKAQIQLMADSAIGDVSSKFDGLNVSKDEINSFMEDLLASSKDLNAMSADQRANYIALRKRGLDDEAAFNKAMTATSDQIKGTVLAMGDPAIAASLKKAQSNITNSMAGVVGGTGKAMDQMTENIRGIESELGNALSPESAAKLGTVMFKLQNDLVKEMTDEEKMLANIIGGKENAKDAKLVAAALKGTDLTTLARLNNISEDFVNIANYQKSGTPLGKTVRSDADNREANSQNTTNGKFSQWGDKFTSGLDLATGGMFSKTANILDEYLGDSADINAVVKNGFKLVLAALRSISMNTSGMGKLLMGLGGAAAVIAIVANWDKIKPKLAPLLDAVKDVAKDIIANLPSFITDAIAGIKSVFSDIFKGGLFGGGSSALSGAKSLVSDSMSSLSGSMSGVDISQNVKELGSSIGSLFGSVMDWIKQALPGLGRILHDIIGCINNAINAVAPALSDICDVLRAAVDGIVALGISIVDCIKELGISIVDCVRELGVSLIEGTRDVLLSIAPAINDIGASIRVLSEALAPVIPTIVETIKFAAETVLPPLVNKLIPDLLKYFKTVLPPIIDLVKEAVKIILPPLMEILNKVADTILPPISEALSVVVGLVDRIVNLVLDILEPPLKAISEAISSIIGVITSIANFVRDIINVAHGLFNFFTSKIPDLIGWISGLFNWLKDGLGPVISSGISVIKDTMSTLWAGLKEIIAIAISPIIMAINAVDVILTSIKLFLAEAPVIGDKTKAEQYQKDLAKAMFKLNGADRGGVEEANYKAAKEAFEEALKSGEKDKIEIAAAAYKKASAEYQSEAGSKVTAAQIDRRVEAASLGKSLDNFTNAITSDILKNGPQMDEAAKEEVLQYLSGQKGNIAAESVLPPNTGSLLDSIKQSSTGIFTIIKSIHDTLVNYITSEKSIPAYGSGTRNGPISTPTKVIVGDKGPEHIIPTKSSSAAKKVLSTMSSFEKNLIATALNGLESSDVPGDDQATIMKILEFAGADAGKVLERLLHGWKGNVKNGFKQRKKWYEEAKANAANQEGRDLIRGTFAEKALEFGVSELGKPYILRSLGSIGYVCNELVNAGIKASGFNMGKFMVHGVNATFANIQKGKYSGNDYPNFRIRDDLTPETATPGMVFFQDSRKTKDGSFEPGHIGFVYYGHQKLHASGGADSYDKSKFLQTWQTPCRGVTVTPFGNGKYVIGEFPGLFESISGEPINRNTESPGESIVSDEITQALQSLEAVNGYALNPNGEIFDRESYNAYLKEKFGDNADAFNALNSDLKQLSSEAVTSAARASSGEQWYVINKYLGNINNSSQLYDLYVSVAEAVKYLREISSRVKQKQSTPVKPVRAPAS